MNERIRELLRKSYHTRVDSETGETITLLSIDQEKFAELIVRECADFIDSNLEMTKHSGEVLSWADGDDLKQYFGVEE